MLKYFPLIIFGPILAFLVKRTLEAGDPVYFILPNALLYTPFVGTTRALWRLFDPHGSAPKIEHKPIAEIDAKDFSMEALRKASGNFRNPTVVRGLFSGSKAVKEWPKVGRLNEILGDFDIPFVEKADFGNQQDSRNVQPFHITSDQILTNSSSKYYIFFPAKSRFHFTASDSRKQLELKNAVNKLVHDDLELSERVEKGFGSTDDPMFKDSQMIMGVGGKTFNETTGTLWHCALGSNWFVQVAGRKRWYFMDQKYSSRLAPLRQGMVTMQVGSSDIQNDLENTPYSWADIETGDLLYNPDFSWHAIKNYEGLAIGVPIRYRSLPFAFRNNLHYATIMITNIFMDRLGFDIGGYAEAKYMV